MELDPARMELLYVFFETYLVLNEEQEEQDKQLKEIINASQEGEKIMKMMTSYEIKGRNMGKAEMVISAFRKRFNDEHQSLFNDLLKLSPDILDELNFTLFSVKDAKQFLNEVEIKLPKQ